MADGPQGGNICIVWLRPPQALLIYMHVFASAHMDQVPLRLLIYIATHQHNVNRNDDKLFPYPGRAALRCAAKQASFHLEAITIYMLKQGSSLSLILYFQWLSSGKLLK